MRRDHALWGLYDLSKIVRSDRVQEPVPQSCYLLVEGIARTAPPPRREPPVWAPAIGKPLAGGIGCPCGLKSPPAVDVWYAVIRDADNAVEHAGRAVWADGILYGTGMDETDSGKTILIAAVWTRHLPREFRYFFDKTCFQPTDPFGVAEPGYYRTRPRSTRNSEYDRFGYRADPFDPDEDGADAIAEGQFARYIGDNSPDPTLATAIPGVEFWLDVFNTSQGLDPLPLTRSISSGDAWHLIDTSQNWVGTRIEHGATPMIRPNVSRPSCQEQLVIVTASLLL